MFERLTIGRPLTSWCAQLHPATLDRYLELGGLAGFRNASAMTPAERLSELRASGLREAGQSAEPLFLAWQRRRQRGGSTELAVDALSLDARSRSSHYLLESNPFGLVEGLMIAARAFQAKRAVLRLPAELSDLEVGLLNAWDDIRGRGLNDGLELVLEFSHGHLPSVRTDGNGHDAERVLTQSIETWYQTVLVFALGAASYRLLPGEAQVGTELVTLGGEVRRPGLVEVAAGAELWSIVEDQGGGVAEGREPLALALDGGLGGFVPPNTRVRFGPEDLLAAVASPRPQTLWVIGKNQCIVDLTREALYRHWKLAEGSDRATRALLARAARLVTQIKVGRAGPGHLADLEAVGHELHGRGLAAAWPLGSALMHFRPLWEQHIDAGRCSADVCFKRPPPPCQAACPANLDIPSFVAHVGHHHYEDAVRVIVQDNPLPMTCGLVCPAPCESACLRGQTTSEPLFIRPMKSVASRHALQEYGRYELPERAPRTGKRVAIIGAGPAGLASAYFLAVRGHAVEIFESQEDAGGMLRYGIPAYRLPSHLLDIELAQIERLGVRIHTGHRVESLKALREQGFDAIFIAPGFQLSRKVPFEGADLPLVSGGMDFLRGVRSGANPRLKERVVVVGGGNVAVDVALTALRQGARHVDMVCLEKRREMPASHGEIEAALAEGVIIQNGWGPLKAGADGQMSFQHCPQVFDENRRFAPRFDAARTLTLYADHVLLAVGQTLDDHYLEDAQLEVQRGLLVADPMTLKTKEIGVFAGGDAVHGPRTVVAAVRAGKQAAASIDAWLRDEDMDKQWGQPQRRDRVAPLATDPHARSHLHRTLMPELEVEQREAYRQVELGLSEAQADKEASRCLRCDICMGCGLCQLVCSEVGPEALHMEETAAGRLAFQDFERPGDRCIGCGACAQVCPTGAIAIEDVCGERRTVITGTAVKRQPLLTCRACGEPFQSPAHRVMVAERVGVRAHEHFGAALCPACARASAARARVAVPG
jgi:NADPH-dependent glutamate synthase beta subunit-like oxidoreductase/NADH:ubiquinone oxidoreductase subunit F (NADH-binding)/formate hydrogenlyase subunit 6/NADH:ubiquinone oxidoreductase subunit I